MNVDGDLGRSLGWPKLTYAAVERERRWLCERIPDDLIETSEAITDLYITGTRLRLREAIPCYGGEAVRRLSRKADADDFTRLITSIYLPPHEFAVFSTLPGMRLKKTRHRLRPAFGATMSVDQFEGPLEGLIIAEAEFSDDVAMAAFPTPYFTTREVTEDSRYRGGALVVADAPPD